MDASPSPSTSERGAVVLTVSLLLLVLLVCVAFAIDVGHWRNVGDRAQRAADAAALAAVGTLVQTEETTGNRQLAEERAAATATLVARQNGFDDADSRVSVNTRLWTAASGIDHAEVEITTGVDLYFASLVLREHSVTESAEAALANCRALCDDIIAIPPLLSAAVDASTGGDGWIAGLTETAIFNLFHHNEGEVLMCIDIAALEQCLGDGSYPVEPYPGMETNYAPQILGVEDQVYFAVQQPNTVGLGCWSAITHRQCPGFEVPVVLAPYQPNDGSRGNVRVAGPERVGTRLFLYGDDNRMHCFDLLTSSLCAGYPKFNTLAGVHDLAPLGVGSPAAGLRIQEQQFDIVAAPDGRLYTTLTPVNGRTWLTCWDATTDGPCAGWADNSTTTSRPWTFLRYDATGNVNGICAAAGGGGGNGTGHECFSLSGSSTGAGVPFSFGGGGETVGQQGASAVNNAGQTLTFFPIRSRDTYACWNWTLSRQCALPPSNWSDTEEYAYVSDGNQCIYGLGHRGLLWSFDINTGRQPCLTPGVAHARIEPCACADGVTRRWTRLTVTDATQLDWFESFVLTLRRPDGSVLLTVDLVQTNDRAVELSFLNDELPPPSYLDVELVVDIKDGQAANIVGVRGVGVALNPMVIPALVD